jgi:histidinol-phosphatase (PHP family)
VQPQNDAIFYDSHMHTPLCRHATGDPEDYAAVAQQRGLKGIIVTCHSPTPFEWSHCMRLDELDAYVALVERAREAWAGRIDVRLGLECDYMPGMEPWLREHLAALPLHHVLGSIHPMLGYYRERYWTGDMAAYTKLYFAHLALAAETGLFDTLAHPDLIKNEDPQGWNMERYLPVIAPALDRIAATGVALELNTSGRNKRLPEMNPAPLMLQAMRERNIPVVLGSDAHDPSRVADHFAAALDLLASVGYHEVSFFLERRRHTLPIADVKRSLQRSDALN